MSLKAPPRCSLMLWKRLVNGPLGRSLMRSVLSLTKLPSGLCMTALMDRKPPARRLSGAHLDLILSARSVRLTVPSENLTQINVAPAFNCFVVIATDFMARAVVIPPIEP